MESDITAAGRTVLARFGPGVAPVGTALPYGTWQIAGGRSTRYADSTPADKRNLLVQVNVWAASVLEAVTLARQIEDALCATTSLQVEPLDEPSADQETDIEPLRYGAVQTLSIWGARS